MTAGDIRMISSIVISSLNLRFMAANPRIGRGYSASVFEPLVAMGQRGINNRGCFLILQQKPAPRLGASLFEELRKTWAIGTEILIVVFEIERGQETAALATMQAGHAGARHATAHGFQRLEAVGINADGTHCWSKQVFRGIREPHGVVELGSR